MLGAGRVVARCREVVRQPGVQGRAARFGEQVGVAEFLELGGAEVLADVGAGGLRRARGGASLGEDGFVGVQGRLCSLVNTHSFPFSNTYILAGAPRSTGNLA